MRASERPADERATTVRQRREWGYRLVDWAEAAKRQCGVENRMHSEGRFLGYILALSAVTRRGGSELLLLELASTIDVSVRVVFAAKAGAA
jgi:hypothetical protein